MFRKGVQGALCEDQHILEGLSKSFFAYLSRIAGGIAGSGVKFVWFLSYAGLPLTNLGSQVKKALR
jgi:hypothetical protein